MNSATHLYQWRFIPGMKSSLTLKLITAIHLINRIKEKKIVRSSQQMQKVRMTELNPYSRWNSQEIRNEESYPQPDKSHGLRFEVIVSGQETTLSSTLPAGSILGSAGDGRWGGGCKETWEGIRNSSPPGSLCHLARLPHPEWSITSRNSGWIQLAVFFIMPSTPGPPKHMHRPHSYLRSLGALPSRPIPNS